MACAPLRGRRFGRAKPSSRGLDVPASLSAVLATMQPFLSTSPLAAAGLVPRADHIATISSFTFFPRSWAGNVALVQNPRSRERPPW